MSVVAVYNMKGGVGKTTTAVNVSFLAAAGGERTLLWDLDPQAASSYAFRIQPRPGFTKKWMESGEVLAAAIRETDYSNLDLLPSDFTYRKLDRLLGHFAKPDRVVSSLLDTFRRDYDVVILDCPAGFSQLTEGMFGAADAIVMPTIPTMLSLRMVATMIDWAIRSDSPADLAPFFSMVDRRKTLHRKISDSPMAQSEMFLARHIPYASVIEQMAVRRMPLAAFAPRDAASTAFAGLWAEIRARLESRTKESRQRERWRFSLRMIESLIASLESPDGEGAGASLRLFEPSPSDPRRIPEPRGLGGTQSAAARNGARQGSVPERAVPGDDVRFVHSFDTASRDLQRSGHVLELLEYGGCMVLVGMVSSDHGLGGGGALRHVATQIDSSSAWEIISGTVSPLEVLEQRSDQRSSMILDGIRAAVRAGRLRRVNSRVAEHPPARVDTLNLRHA